MPTELDPFADCDNAAPASCRYVGDNIPETPYDQPIEAPDTELDRIREACAPQEYRALGLGECVEIAEAIELPHNRNQEAVNLITREYTLRGFDPRDIRQCAEEALERHRTP